MDAESSLGGVKVELVFLLEEESMREALNNILPKILPPDILYKLIPHKGKSDLLRSIPRKIRGWIRQDVRFVILHDKDSNDCVTLKQHLLNLARTSGRPDTLVRIVCTELESWFLGDLDAVSMAYSIRTDSFRNKSKYRQPDKLANAKQELRNIIPEYQPLSGAKTISEHMDVTKNKSRSFSVFVAGLNKLYSETNAVCG